MKKKLAVFFPGIGYNCDKPLLHYTRRIVTAEGFEIILLDYKKDTFPGGRLSREGMESAVEQCIKKLKSVKWASYDDILFVGKSVGTYASIKTANYYEEQNNDMVHVRYIAFTPVRPAFALMKGKAVEAFSGTADRVVDYDLLTSLARSSGALMHYFRGANHSLEVPKDTLLSIQYLYQIMESVTEIVKRGPLIV